MTQPKDVDPEGDVTLVVGDQQIRASSKVLALASPVFATMLGPYFAEGQAKNPSITLPEDDVEAVTWLCKALHFKLSANERLISFRLGRTLATLCDKYDTSVAISNWSAMWMQNWKGSVDGNISYAALLHMSYAFGHHKAFWCTSRDVMQYYTANGMKQIENELQSETLPYRLLGKSS